GTIAVEHALGRKRALVARAARPAGRIAAFAFLERHGHVSLVGMMRATRGPFMARRSRRGGGWVRGLAKYNEKTSPIVRIGACNLGQRRLMRPQGALQFLESGALVGLEAAVTVLHEGLERRHPLLQGVARFLRERADPGGPQHLVGVDRLHGILGGELAGT